MSIKLLDQQTINQIAAGEVIDRPSSVVKELVENSIDAGATIITVEIKDGGVSLIRITDNGEGIVKDDVKLAFLRHSTSKIKDALDLVSVKSLGFRGEALSSIAAVSMVELMTKRADELLGVRYVIEGGEEKSLDEIGIPDGTTFIVRNLFYNTPARRKFLKSSQTEAGYISDIVTRIALSHPEISVRFIVNGQSKLHTPGNGNLKDAIYNVYGREITSNLLTVNSESKDIKITGFVCKPVVSRGNRTYENYFINGRYIKSAIINKAIEDAYSSYIMQHRYPFTVMHFEIPTEEIDVNVHPAKMELRIKNSAAVYENIVACVKEALSRKELINEIVFDNKVAAKPLVKPEFKTEVKPEFKTEVKPELKSEINLDIKPENKPEIKFETKPEIKATVKPEINDVVKPEIKAMVKPEIKDMVKPEPKIEPKSELNTEKLATETVEKQTIESKIDLSKERPAEPFEIKREAQTKNSLEYDFDKIIGIPQVMFKEEFISKEARAKHRIIGQLFKTYWLVEFDNNLYIIDQHAAHEKVLYERMIKQIEARNVISEQLLTPIVLNLSLKEKEMIDKYIECFKELGYEIEDFGGNDICVRALPYDLLNIDKKELLRDLIDSLSEDIGVKAMSLNNIKDRIATMSCKAAVKGNNILSEKEANELIDELLTLENPYNCPHGRPTIISMSQYEIEKKFKRIV